MDPQRKRLAEIVERLKALATLEESRALTEAEASEFSTLEAEGRSIKGKLSRRGAADELEAWTRAAAPGQPARPDLEVDDPEDESARPRQRGKAPAAKLSIEAREKRDYSLLALCRSFAAHDPNQARVERYYSDQIEERTGRQPQGFFIPYTKLLPLHVEAQVRAKFASGEYREGVPHALERRDITKGTTGAEAVGTDLLPAEFIELLRNLTISQMLGARLLPGLVGDVDLPRQIAGGAFAWMAAETTDASTDTTFDLDKVTLTPKTGAIKHEMTRRMLKQSTPAIEDLAREDIRAGIGVGIDAAVIAGSGGAQPTGILNVVGIGAVDATGGLSWGDCVELEGDVATANALQGRLAYATRPAVVSVLKTTAKAANTFTGFLMDPDGKVNGYPCGISNQIPASTMVFGNWADLLIGLWGVLDMFPDPYTRGDRGGLVLRGFQDIDVALRHPASFSATTNIP